MESNEEKFSRIYDEYIEKIYRFVYLKVNSREIAEDITSQVFTKGWQSFQSQREPIVNVNAFLYQISKNLIVDHYREKGRTIVVSAEGAAELADHKNDIHSRAIVNADMETVKSAMQNLKKDYQDVLIWHYLEDMSSQEIAVMLSKSPGAVRVMIHRGLESLKGILEA